MPDVLAIGNAIVDIITHVDDAFLDRHGLVKDSMALIDGARAEELYADMPPAIEASGGSAANTAVGVAQLGSTAAFIGKIRDDQLGAVYRHDLRSAGVAFDTPEAAASHPEPTGRSMILVTPDAHRTMNTNLGIAGLVGVEDLDEQLLAGSRFVYAEGYLWDSLSAREAILAAVDLTAAAGGTFAFTLSDGFCVDRHRAGFLDLLDRGVGVLFANDTELRSLFEVDDFEVALDRLRGRCPVAFVTRGALGSVALRGDEEVRVEADPVDELVDTTGAGDLYAAGALHALCRGADLATAARLGSLAAAEVIGHVGPRPQADLRSLADAAGLP